MERRLELPVSIFAIGSLAYRLCTVGAAVATGIAFVTIVRHMGPNAPRVLPTGRLSTLKQRMRGTVHAVFPEIIDWFFNRLMQHLAHHVSAIIARCTLKEGERDVIVHSEQPVVERWPRAYHWRLLRDCKLYDPERDGWCNFNVAPTGQPVSTMVATHRL